MGEAQGPGLLLDAASRTIQRGRAEVSLIAELNRRGVTRVASAYVVVAWLLLQVAEILLPAYGFGNGAIRTLVVLLAAGFLPALVLAWAFEITPSGVKADRDVDRKEPVAPLGRSRLDRAIMAVLALALGFFLFDKFAIEPARKEAALEAAYSRGRSESASIEVDGRSIVVLPFANLSGDPDQEYLSDGISEELLNLLTGIPKLRVVSRSSAFAFKDQNPGIAEIARLLDVTHVLEGSVRIAGDVVRITAQLIDARTDSHVWSQSYDRVLDDILAVEDDIASRVVDRLEVSLHTKPRAGNADPEAYVLYLRAAHLAKQSTEASYERARGLLREALERDPAYADAWLLTSSIYGDESGMGLRPFRDGYQLAEDAARAALAIDPGRARTHCQLSSIILNRDLDVARSAQQLRQALGSGSRDDWCLDQAAVLFDAMGDSERSIALRKDKLRRDPLSAVASLNLAYSLYLVGRPDESMAALEDARILSPDMAGLEAMTAFVYLSRASAGDLERALQAAQREPVEGFRLQTTSIVHHRLGHRAEADAALEAFIEDHGDGWPFNIAVVFADRGEPDLAFAWLDRAMASGDAGLVSARVEPVLAPLHTDSRWPEFLDELGLAGLPARRDRIGPRSTRVIRSHGRGLRVEVLMRARGGVPAVVTSRRTSWSTPGNRQERCFRRSSRGCWDPSFVRGPRHDTRPHDLKEPRSCGIERRPIGH